MKRVIYVDVDDTLIRTVSNKRIPMVNTVAAIKRLHHARHELYLWSRGGADYAREVAEQLQIAQCFRAFLPKPEILIDDRPSTSWMGVEVRPENVDALETGALGR